MNKGRRRGRTTNEVMERYGEGGVQLSIRELDDDPDDSYQPYVLLQGDRRSLLFLSEVVAAVANEEDCGLQMAPNGPGNRYFAADSTKGFYIHRLPCTSTEDAKPSGEIDPIYYPLLEAARNRSPMTDPLPHACEIMQSVMDDDGDLPVDFNPKFREYGILYLGGHSYREMVHCPFCGARLPGSLREEWFRRLDALGLEPEDPRVPEKMGDSRWWREEGL